MNWSGRSRAGEHADLERAEGAAGVAVADFGEKSSASSSSVTRSLPRPRVLIGERSADERLDVVDRQRLELEHAAAADQRAVDGEEGILRRRADEDHDAVFDIGQQHVLLGPVEAVDFVDEEERPLAGGGEPVAGIVEDFAKFFDAAGDGADLRGSGCGCGGEQFGPAWFCRCRAGRRR